MISAAAVDRLELKMSRLYGIVEALEEALAKDLCEQLLLMQIEVPRISQVPKMT